MNVLSSTLRFSMPKKVYMLAMLLQLVKPLLFMDVSALLAALTTGALTPSNVLHFLLSISTKLLHIDMHSNMNANFDIVLQRSSEAAELRRSVAAKPHRAPPPPPPFPAHALS